MALLAAGTAGLLAAAPAAVRHCVGRLATAGTIVQPVPDAANLLPVIPKQGTGAAVPVTRFPGSPRIFQRSWLIPVPLRSSVVSCALNGNALRIVAATFTCHPCSI